MDAPWNGLANSVAKACRTTSASRLPPDVRNAIKDHAGIEWDWLLHAQPSIRAAYPAQSFNMLAATAPSNFGVHPQPYGRQISKHMKDKTGEEELTLSLVSFNARSLHDSGAERSHTRFAHRAALLRQEARDRGICFMGGARGRHTSRLQPEKETGSFFFGRLPRNSRM